MSLLDSENEGIFRGDHYDRVSKRSRRKRSVPQISIPNARRNRLASKNGSNRRSNSDRPVRLNRLRPRRPRRRPNSIRPRHRPRPTRTHPLRKPVQSEQHALSAHAGTEGNRQRPVRRRPGNDTRYFAALSPKPDARRRRLSENRAELY